MNPEFTQHFKNLPSSIQNLLKFVISEIQPEQIILFGSRARGTHRPTSDFDIAVKKTDMPASPWAKVLVALDDEAYTLYKIDLVHYEKLDNSYVRNITKEGVLIYG